MTRSSSHSFTRPPICSPLKMTSCSSRHVYHRFSGSNLLSHFAFRKPFEIQPPRYTFHLLAHLYHYLWHLCYHSIILFVLGYKLISFHHKLLHPCYLFHWFYGHFWDISIYYYYLYSYQMYNSIITYKQANKINTDTYHFRCLFLIYCVRLSWFWSAFRCILSIRISYLIDHLLVKLLPYGQQLDHIRTSYWQHSTPTTYIIVYTYTVTLSETLRHTEMYTHKGS